MMQRILSLFHFFEVGTRIINMVNAFVSEDYIQAVEEVLHIIIFALSYVAKRQSR